MYKTTTDIFSQIDDIFNGIQKAIPYQGFPFVDVLEDTENEETIIRIAVAGFAKDELKVETEKDKLIVSGRHDNSVGEATGVVFRVQNIKKADFQRVFPLKKGAFVTGVQLENGILEISLGYEVPEDEKRAEYVIHQE